MAKTFEAQIKAFADKTSANMLAVAQESIQDVLADASLTKAKGGRMPVDTGYLRNSVASGLNGTFGPADTATVNLTIAKMKLGDLAQFAWTAEYARRIELGFSGADKLGRTYNQQGAHFLGAAAAKWQQFVTANAARIK